jgi:hypothetical protein
MKLSKVKKGENDEVYFVFIAAHYCIGIGELL